VTIFFGVIQKNFWKGISGFGHVLNPRPLNRPICPKEEGIFGGLLWLIV
jgi:hypothetical protein